MKIGIFHPTDLAGHVPGGIDTFIRGIMRWAPADLQYVLIGATSDPVARPVGAVRELTVAGTTLRYLPIVTADASGTRRRVPLTVRYIAGLGHARKSGLLDDLDALDFHRIETALAFHNDRRPRNLFLHQDMAILRDSSCDIGWRHAPWLYEWLETRAFSRLDRVFSVRQTAIDRYTERYPSWKDKFCFTPTWVEPDLFVATHEMARGALRQRLFAELQIKGDDPLLLSVGRFDRQKDPMLMLEAFARLREKLPEARLIMVGGGILREQVEERIREPDIAGRVHLTGPLPPARIAEFLQAADVFLLSSAYEGMPIVVLEALACGLPVVTTDVGEVRRSVRDGVNGRVVKVRDAKIFAAAVADVVCDRSRYAGPPCIESAAEFTPQNVLRQIYETHRREGHGLRCT